MFASALVALTTCFAHAGIRGAEEWTFVASYPIPEGASMGRIAKQKRLVPNMF